MGNENKERLICGYKESEIKSQLDYVMSKWEMTPLEDLITPENEFFYSDREAGDYMLKCKTCGTTRELSPREILRLHDCYYCCKLAEHLASRSFGNIEKVKQEDIEFAVGEFRDFLTSVMNLILVELEVPQRTDLIPNFKCLSELLCNRQPVSRVDSWFVGALIETKHQIVVSLIIDLLAWIQETEPLVATDSADYPLPWRSDSSNQMRIERAISTLEKLRKRAIHQRLWMKDETGFHRSLTQSEILSFFISMNT